MVTEELMLVCETATKMRESQLEVSAVPTLEFDELGADDLFADFQAQLESEAALFAAEAMALQQRSAQAACQARRAAQRLAASLAVEDVDGDVSCCEVEATEEEHGEYELKQGVFTKWVVLPRHRSPHHA